MLEELVTVEGASILNGEIAEADDSGFEEIVNGTVPVSDGSEVVEQGVQGQAQAIDQQGFAEVPGQQRQGQV